MTDVKIGDMTCKTTDTVCMLKAAKVEQYTEKKAECTKLLSVDDTRQEGALCFIEYNALIEGKGEEKKAPEDKKAASEDKKAASEVKEDKKPDGTDGFKWTLKSFSVFFGVDIHGFEASQVSGIHGSVTEFTPLMLGGVSWHLAQVKSGTFTLKFGPSVMVGGAGAKNPSGISDMPRDDDPGAMFKFMGGVEGAGMFDLGQVSLGFEASLGGSYTWGSDQDLGALGPKRDFSMGGFYFKAGPRLELFDCVFVSGGLSVVTGKESEKAWGTGDKLEAGFKTVGGYANVGITF